MGQAAGDRLNPEAEAFGGETRRLRFALAGADDNADINRLLKDTPVPGWISLSYEREPDYFRASATEGDLHETLLGRDRRTGELIVMASFSIRDAWVNGEPARVGYLGQLRLVASHLSRPWPVLEGYRFIRRMVERRSDVRYVLTSIVSTNERAKRLLTSGSRNLPTYRPIGGFWTLAYPSRRRARSVPGIELVRGSTAESGEIARFLDKQARRFQFAPRWSADQLWDDRRCPDLGPEDFLLARRGDSLAGCVALWDQCGFKQHVVRGYAAWIDRLRPLINLPAAALGLPRLPAPGSALRQLSLSHLAVEDDDPGVLRALLGEALAQAAAREVPLTVTGLGDEHPLLGEAKAAARHLAYRSDIYLVHWGDEDPRRGLDDRPMHLEAAVL